MPVVPDNARPSSATGSAGSRPRPRNRARSVSHSTGPCGRPFEAQGVERPRAGLARIARPAMAEQRRAVRQVLGLDEQLAERRVREVVGGGHEDDLRVAGDVDLPDARAVVAHREPPHFDVVFRRHRDVEVRREVVVAPPEARPIGGERDGVVVRLPARRLIGGGPDGAAANVAQVDELPVRVARGVAAPARDRKRAPHAAATAGIGDRGDVVPVRQELRVRSRGVRGAVAADRSRRQEHGDAQRVQGPRLDRSAVAPGTRSCSSSSVAWTRGSAWKRSTIRSPSSALARATSVMPAWCAR